MKSVSIRFLTCCLSVLLSLPFSKVRADQSFNQIWATYNIGGEDQGGALSSNKALGNVSKFTIKDVYLKCHDNWGASRTAWSSGTLYYKFGGQTIEKGNTSATWKPDGWAEADYQFEILGWNQTIIENTSGNYTVQFYGKVSGAAGDSWLSNGGNNYTWTFSILPPAVSGFSVSGNGEDVIAGSGTQQDPYVVRRGGSLMLSASGSQAHSDANSAICYKFGSGDYSQTSSHTISGITAEGSVEVKALYRNNSASLDGAASSQTIYYQPEETPVLTITATAAAGTIYTGQVITLTPTTNVTGAATLCWICRTKPDGATDPVYTPAEGTTFTTSVDKAGEYVFSATIGRGECGGPGYELLATAPNCTIQVADVPYRLYITEGAQDLPFVNGQAQATLEAGKEYMLKLHTGGEPDTWYTNVEQDGGLNVMDATNHTGWGFNSTLVANETRLATTIAGTYTFTIELRAEGRRYLSVNYPEGLPRSGEMDGTAVKANNPDIMIQAFYWAHDGNTATDYTPFGSVKWADLDGKELGENFDLVWLAPSTVTADYTGYLPYNYSIQGTIQNGDNGRSWLSDYHSPWGSEAELKSLIQDIHTGGGKAIADVVINHSNADDGSWCQWTDMKFGNSTNNTLYGSYRPDWRWVSRNDEMFLSKQENQYGQKDQAGDCGTKDLSNNVNDDFYVTRPGGGTYSWDYTEYNCTYSRDWAHGKREVREMSRAYLLWMKNEIGYDGWRYDFAKGFHGRYINEYNRASGACFSVSELFEGDVSKLEGFLLDAGRNSYVFDFPAKYNMMNNAIRNGWYQGLKGAAATTMTYGDFGGNRRSRYAVTFVDNHDTFREGTNLSGRPNQMPNTGNQVLQANAYILCMPGVPCVFYPYWHEYKDAIRAMVWARRWAGIHSESTVYEPQDGVGDGKYCARITGTNGSIWLKLGPNAGVTTCPDGYTAAYVGENVGVYYQITSAAQIRPYLTANPTTQEFYNTLSVTLLAHGADCTIRYTTDGSNPETYGTEYSEQPIAISATTTLKAIAINKANTSMKSAVMEYQYTKVADKINLLPSVSSASVGSKITLTPSAESGTAYNYHFFVKEPGAQNFMSCGYSSAAMAYVLQGEGYYEFYVTATANELTYNSLVIRVLAEPQVYYLRFKKNSGADDLPDNWAKVQMIANADGTYVYYSDGTGQGSSAESLWFGKGANVGLNGTSADPYFRPEDIANPDEVASGNRVVWTYNAFERTLRINNPSTKIFKISVTLPDGRVYYSNNIYKVSEQTPVSFYAQPGSQLAIECYGGATGVWSKIGAIDLPSVVTASGVYQALATVSISGDGTEQSPYITTCALTDVAAYTGDFFITSPALPSATNTMTRFNSDTYYNHYFVEWIEAGQNTFGTVGNSINHNLAGAVGYYLLPSGANVRYAYHPATNVFTRTHIAGSTEGGRYLATFGTNIQGKVDSEQEYQDITTATDGLVLKDASNWIYTADVRVKQTEGTGVASALKLVSQYNGAYTYLLAPDGLDSEGAKRDLTQAGNSMGEYPVYNLVYDYKTNRILTGWNPEGRTIESVTSVPNLTIRRTDDGTTSLFTIGEGKSVTTNQMTTEFVITRAMWDSWTGSEETLDEQTYKTLLFWISLPYDCTIRNIYGFGATYRAKTNTTWEMQIYRGDMRGAGTLGGSSPWMALAPISKLKANTGYVLAVRLCAADFKTIGETSEVRFFFPSDGMVNLSSQPVTTLAANSGSAPEIQQGWNVMGVPVMQSGRAFSGQHFEFAYRWSWAGGSRYYEPLKLTDGEHYFDFQPGHAYMVQVGQNETLTWSYTEQGGTPWAPVRQADSWRMNLDLRIDLVADEQVLDKTYVLYRSNGSRDYERGRDLEKIMNEGRSMLYTHLDEPLASLCLPGDEDAPIPLTVVAAQSGDYVLRLPAFVAGAQPVLYDAMTGVSTMLNYTDCLVSLPQGTCEGRFYLTVRPADTPTCVVNTVSEGDEVVKYVDENGCLMIWQAGRVYNALGNRIQ